MTTTMCISELNDAAYTLAPSGFAPPLLASTRTSLLACSLDFGQVGLGHNSCPHPLGNNNEFHALTPNPNASGLTRRDLIHTLLDFTVAQDLEKKKAEPKTPHFLSLNQDAVAWSQEAKV